MLKHYFPNRTLIAASILLFMSSAYLPANAGITTSKTGQGVFDGFTPSILTSDCINSGFPDNAEGSSLCADVSSGNFDTDCMNWGLDQTPIISVAACSGLSYAQFADFKQDYITATSSISSGGNGFDSYTQQKNFFSSYPSNVHAIYANNLGYGSGDSSQYAQAVAASSSMQSQCASSTTSPLAVCSSSISYCACIPKGEYESISTGAVAVAAVLEASRNDPHTLTQSLLDDVVGLVTTNTDLTDPNALDYLALKFSTLDLVLTDTPAELQPIVDEATPQEVARNTIGAIVADPVTHPVSGLTVDLLDDALGEAITQQALDANAGITLEDLQNALLSSGLTAMSTMDEFRTFLADGVGFSSLESFDNFLANLDRANFNLAAWEACFASTQAGTGGAGGCVVPNGVWLSIDDLEDVLNGLSDLTGDNVTDALNAVSEAASTELSLSDALHLIYLENCIEGSSDVVTDIVACARDFTEAKLAAFIIGNIAEVGTGDYDPSALTAALLETLGVVNNTLDVINGNYCGATGLVSCLEQLQAAIQSAALTADSTIAAILQWIDDLMVAQMMLASDGTNGDIPDDNVAAGCSSTVELDLPPICAHPQWQCSLEIAPDDWTITNDRIIVPVNQGTGVKNVTVRKTLLGFSTAYTDDETRAYTLGTAVNGAVGGKKFFTRSDMNIAAMSNNCVGLGGRLATRPEFGDFPSTASSSGLPFIFYAPSTTHSNYSEGNWSSGNAQYKTGVANSCSYPPFINNQPYTHNQKTRKYRYRTSSTAAWSNPGGASGQWRCGAADGASEHRYACMQLPSCS